VDKDAPCLREDIIDGMRRVLAASKTGQYWPQLPMKKGLWKYDNEFPAWEMRDVEHTLCEFDKYERVRLGEGRPRSVFRPAA
jgi:hypothetical protein